MVGQQGLETGRRCGAEGILAAGNLDDVGAAVAGRQLDDAEAVPVMVEPHGFGIDGNRISVAADIRQVAAMQANRHDLSPKSPQLLLAMPRGIPILSMQTIENKEFSPVLLQV
jgi:hypothetical protein